MIQRNSPQNLFDWKEAPKPTQAEKKAWIIKETKSSLLYLRAWIIAWWIATIMGVTDSAMAKNMNMYEPLADASGTILVKKKWEVSDPWEITEIIRKSWASKTFEQTIIEMSRQNRDLMIQTGKSVLRVEAIYRPSQLVNNWDLLPKSKLYKTLTKDNYSQIVTELFDISDTKKWLRNPDWSEFSKTQKVNYAEQMWIEAKRYQKKLDEFRTKFSDKAVEQFINLYNSWAAKMSNQSREELRRLLVAASSIVFFVNSDDNTRTKYAWITATQLWEYIILTWWEGGFIVAKVMVWENTQDALKYLLPWEIAIKNFNSITWLNVPPNLSEIALRIITETFNNNLKIVQWEKKIWEIQAERRKIQKDTEEANKRIRKLDTEIGKLDRSTYLKEECEKIADEIELKVKEFIKNPWDKEMENKINSLIVKFRNFKKQAEKELSKDNLRWIIAISNAMETTWIPKFFSLTKPKS